MLSISSWSYPTQPRHTAMITNITIYKHYSWLVVVTLYLILLWNMDNSLYGVCVSTIYLNHFKVLII